jgi:hypothetical protein
MAKAVQCDRCGIFAAVVDIDNTEGRKWIVITIDDRSHSFLDPAERDDGKRFLCPHCSELFDAFMRNSTGKPVGVAG